MNNSTLELSYGEMTLLALALRQLQAKEMKRSDRSNLAALDYKLKISYKGQKYRLMLIEEEGTHQPEG